jgi:hypothetical protein
MHAASFSDEDAVTSVSLADSAHRATRIATFETIAG